MANGGAGKLVEGAIAVDDWGARVR